MDIVSDENGGETLNTVARRSIRYRRYTRRAFVCRTCFYLAADFLPYHECKGMLQVFSGTLRGGLAKKLEISRADPSVGSLAASALLREWFLSEDSVASTGGAGNDKGSAWDEDTSVLAWMESKADSIKGHLEQLKFGRVPAQVSLLATAFPDAVLEGLLSVTGGLSKKARQDLLDRLSSP